MICRIYYCTAFLFYATMLYGQETISIEKAIEKAIENNLQIKHAQLGASIAKTKYQSAQLGLMPVISATAGDNYSWGRSIDPQTNNYISEQFKYLYGGINSSITIFSGFKLLHTIKRTKQEVEISRSQVDKIKNDITAEVAVNYIKMLYLEEIIKSLQNQISSSATNIIMAELKYKEGHIAESEIFKIKLQKANEEAVLITTQNELLTAYLDFKQLLNLPLNTNFRLSAPPFQGEVNGARFLNPDSVIEVAIQKNPITHLSQLKTGTAKTNVSLSQSARYPVIRVGSDIGSNFSNTDPTLNFKRQVNANLSYGLRISASIPLFNSFKNSLEIKEKKIILEQSRIENKVEQSKVVRIVTLALNDQRAALVKYQAAGMASNFAIKSYEADFLKFETGRISITELNTSKNTLLQSEAEMIKAKYDYILRTSLVNFYLGHPLQF